MVRLALIFYGVILAASVVMTWLWGDWATWFPQREAWGYGLDVVLGLLLGVAIVLLSQWITPKFRSGRLLTREFAQMFGPIGSKEIAILALSSGIAEEALFRATLQPWIGWIAASLLFGLLHVNTKKEYLYWTAFALLFGFLIGGLVELRQGLVFPTVAHVTVNYCNMHWIVGHYREHGLLAGQEEIEKPET